MTMKKVAIIGAGPCGLSLLRAFRAAASQGATIPDIVSHRNSRGCLGDGQGGTIIFEDDFESGDWVAGGWSPKNGRAKNWQLGGVHGWIARLKRVTWIQNAISTAGFSGIRIAFDRRSKNYANGEFLRAQWHDGNNWNTMEDSNDGSWGHMHFNLPPSADNNASFQIRFKTNAITNQHRRSDLDNVMIVGN
jgi:hypothetical protein